MWVDGQYAANTYCRHWFCYSVSSLTGAAARILEVSTVVWLAFDINERYECSACRMCLTEGCCHTFHNWILLYVKDKLHKIWPPLQFKRSLYDAMHVFLLLIAPQTHSRMAHAYLLRRLQCQNKCAVYTPIWQVLHGTPAYGHVPRLAGLRLVGTLWPLPACSI